MLKHDVEVGWANEEPLLVRLGTNSKIIEALDRILIACAENALNTIRDLEFVTKIALLVELQKEAFVNGLNVGYEMATQDQKESKH